MTRSTSVRRHIRRTPSGNQTSVIKHWRSLNPGQRGFAEAQRELNKRQNEYNNKFKRFKTDGTYNPDYDSYEARKARYILEGQDINDPYIKSKLDDLRKTRFDRWTKEELESAYGKGAEVVQQIPLDVKQMKDFGLIDKAYVGKREGCRCGCRGDYYDKSTPAGAKKIQRIINRMNKNVQMTGGIARSERYGGGNEQYYDTKIGNTIYTVYTNSKQKGKK